MGVKRSSVPSDGIIGSIWKWSNDLPLPVGLARFRFPDFLTVAPLSYVIFQREKERDSESTGIGWWRWLDFPFSFTSGFSNVRQGTMMIRERESEKEKKSSSTTGTSSPDDYCWAVSPTPYNTGSFAPFLGARSCCVVSTFFLPPIYLRKVNNNSNYYNNSSNNNC